MADLPNEPVTRQEMYLSRLAGENTTLPVEPLTREEMYLEGAIDRVEAVEEEVEELKNSPDVVDIVDTYADLQAYDTSKLTDKDVIRVLADETHGGNSTYYRFTKSSNTWTFIGEISGSGAIELTSTDYDYPSDTPTAVALWRLDPGMYYADTGVALRPSLNNLIISDAATVFIGADSGGGNNVFRQILIIKGSASDIQLYYVKPDGTYGAVDNLLVGAKVQTPGDSSSSIMSQNAVTEMVFADPASRTKIRIGNTNNGGTNSISIGAGGQANGKNAIQLGPATAYSDFSICFSSGYSYATDGIAIGRNSGVVSGNNKSVALGAYSKTTRAGEVNIGTGTDSYGYNSTKYRVLGGVHDPVDAHDAATKDYVDNLAIQNAGAPTTSTVGAVGQLLEDTTNGKLYQCTAIDTTDPQNPSYTWSEVGGGGGVTVVQTTGTSTTDVMSQNAVSSALFADPTTQQLVQIGHNADAGNYTGSFIGRIAIGLNAKATGDLSNIAIGSGVSATTTATNARAIGIGGSATKDNTINIGGVQRNADGKDNVIIGFDASVEGSSRDYCVAIGRGAHCSRRAEVNIGTGTFTTKGYNNTAYRVLGGVHDPVDAHDAATKGYVDANVVPTTFYAPFDIYQSQAGNVSIYLDEDLTRAATGGDFYDAMAKYGQVILCALPSYVDSDYHRIVSVYVHQPYEKSATAFDSYPPEVYFAIPNYPGFASATLGFNSADPDATAFSYATNAQ